MSTDTHIPKVEDLETERRRAETLEWLRHRATERNKKQRREECKS